MYVQNELVVTTTNMVLHSMDSKLEDTIQTGIAKVNHQISKQSLRVHGIVACGSPTAKIKYWSLGWVGL